MFSPASSTSRRSFALVGSATLVAAGLAVAVAPPSVSNDDIPCDATFATLVIENGQNQYFECADSEGTLQQRLASKNPWVNEAEPALFARPEALPGEAVPQVFTGRVQGAGVISDSDATGAERDSISRNEVLIIKKDRLEPSFSSVTLKVNVLEEGTVIKVESLDGLGVDRSDADPDVEGDQGLPLGMNTVEFFADDDEGVFTDGFRISTDSGEFQLASGSTFNFNSIECDLIAGQSCRLKVGTTTLKATYTGDSTENAPEPVTVRVTVDDAAQACGNVDLPDVDNPLNFYNIEVYCERLINYADELPGEVDLQESGNLEDLKDCAAIDGAITELSTSVPDGKEACILNLEWTSKAGDGDGLREFLSDNNLNGDPRYR